MKTVRVDPRDFVLAGGKFSLAEWVSFDEDEREAVLEAKKEAIEIYAAAAAAKTLEALTAVLREIQTERELAAME